MFKGFDCDSITVPSCNVHNCRKSGSDEAIVSAFLQPLRNGALRYGVEPEIQIAIGKAVQSFEQAKRTTVNAPLLSDPPPKLVDLPNITLLAPSADIRSWIRQLTAALVYDAARFRDLTINWNEVAAWSPDFIAKDDRNPLPFNEVGSVLSEYREIDASLDGLPWLEGWSAHPRAYPSVSYSFDLCIQPTAVIFRHNFYRQYVWYVWIYPKEKRLCAYLRKRIQS